VKKKEERRKGREECRGGVGDPSPTSVGLWGLQPEEDVEGQRRNRKTESKT
jgi:hypothetical protein